jgi:sugar lactone lactonase YvrE
MRAELMLDCRNQHGEGVFWSAEHRLLFWTDIHGETIWTFDPHSGTSASYSTPGRACCFATRKDRPATQIVVAFADGFAFLDLASGKRTSIASFEVEKPTTRLNDGRTDPHGRFIAGGMDEKALEPISSVCRLDPDLTVTRLFDGVACANSTCFSPDGRTMYFADSPTREIVAFDYDPQKGTLGAKRVMAKLAPDDGLPDGSCVDGEGYIWNAIWEGYRVERRAPDGRLDRAVDVPVRKPTCCAFGGDDLGTLYITSSRLAETDEALAREPTAGGLFMVRPGIRGIADPPFAG